MVFRKEAEDQPVPRTRRRSFCDGGGCGGGEEVRSSKRERVFSARKRG